MCLERNANDMQCVIRDYMQRFLEVVGTVHKNLEKKSCHVTFSGHDLRAHVSILVLVGWQKQKLQASRRTSNVFITFFTRMLYPLAPPCSSLVVTEGLWWAYLPKQNTNPPNWNMRH